MFNNENAIIFRKFSNYAKCDYKFSHERYSEQFWNLFCFVYYFSVDSEFLRPDDRIATLI